MPFKLVCNNKEERKKMEKKYKLENPYKFGGKRFTK